MNSNDILFYMLFVSAALLLVLFLYILRYKNRSQIHYVFLSTLGFLFIWCFTLIIESYVSRVNSNLVMIFENISYIGICFTPVTLLLTGIIYMRTKIIFNWKYKLLFAVPLISTLILWTNDWHHLFYEVFSTNTSEVVFGNYFVIHSVYSYICILVGLYYLLYFSIKNSGFFSKQSILIFIGSIVPFGINVLVTLKILFVSPYTTPISFSFAVVFYMLAIFKFKFLNIVPVALQNVVDRISDSYMVINEELNIIDYNRTFLNTFMPLVNIKRNDNLRELLRNNKFKGLKEDLFVGYIQKARKEKQPVVFEWHMHETGVNKYFTVEITSIISKESFLGTIVLLKDITQSKKDLETIKNNQIIIMEQERLASLGQLIGGIAHNLKTPIMSLSGAIEALRDLATEYKDSIGDPAVTSKDHKEIAEEMLTWLNKMKPYCGYMSDIISTVKGQAVRLSSSTSEDFTIDELVKRINILMKHELKKYHCILETNFSIDTSTVIKGELNSLVQIFDNIIMNAIQAYREKSGKIDFGIIKNDEGNIVFSIRDYAKGINPAVQHRIFHEMVTTKGKNGTGLGLYMSYSTIKGRFGGDMWFESTQGAGTTFYISLPVIADDADKGLTPEDMQQTDTEEESISETNNATDRDETKDAGDPEKTEAAEVAKSAEVVST